MMENDGEIKKDYLREGNIFNVINPEDMELAFLLQNVETIDIGFIRKLVFRYGSDLYRWIEAILTFALPRRPIPEEILEVVQEVLVKAFEKVEQFNGQNSIFTWLLFLSYPIIQRKKRTLQHAIDNSHAVDEHDRNRKTEDGIDFRNVMYSISEHERSTILLHHLFGFGIRDIAHILGLPASIAFKRFSNGRSRFLEWSEKSHKDRLIQEYLVGLVDNDENEFRQLEDHIHGCSQCQAAVIHYKDLDKKFAAYFDNEWGSPPINLDRLDFLAQEIYETITNRPKTRIFKFEARKSAWFFGFALLFGLMAIVFIKLTPVEREFPQPILTEAPQLLPPVIEIEPVRGPANLNQNPSIVPRYVEPDFSGDGNWGVFSSINADPISGLLLLPTIELYDRSSNEITVIHEGVGSLSAFWSGWDLSPTISADGRWIAYPGTVDTQLEGSVPCTTLQKNSCVDIFLFDRSTGVTRQITQGWNGDAANGLSLSPAISADGEWLAFWSTATNLTKDDEIPCEIDSRSPVCMYVYLFNQASGEIEKLPVGTTVSGTSATLGPISITSDGRYIGYTISILGETTYPATYDGVTYNILGNEVTRSEHYRSYDYFDLTTDAIIYDRDTGEAEILNRNGNGVFGNGASSSPVLSANGRYAAFVSGSTNLVEADTNVSTDIFVKDRESGEIEIVSINSAGEIGNNDSGFTQWRKGYNSLDISYDGKYVVFESTATNLGQRLDSDCYYYQTTNCILLYIHNRETKQTELINALPYGDFLRYPNISEDGRWISYMQSKYKCNTQQDFCSNVMLYDQSNRWVRNLTNYGMNVPNLSWSPNGTISLPWQAWESKTISFSNRGDLLAVGGMDSKIRIWKIDSTTGSIIGTDPVKVVDTGKNDIFTVITFSPNERWLLAGTTSGAVYTWKLPGGEMIYTIDEKPGFVKDLVFANDCSELIIMTSEKTSIWQIQDGQMVNDTKFVNGVIGDLSPHGNLLAYDHGDGETWLQLLPGGEIVGRLSNGEAALLDMVFSEDGSMLAVRGRDGMVIIWRIQEENQGAYKVTYQNSFESVNENGSMVFSPDNIYLTTSGTYGDVVMWSIFSGEMFIVTSSFQDRRIDSMSFTPSGGLLAVLVEDEVSLWKPNQEITYRYFNQATESLYKEGLPHPLAEGNDIPEIIEFSQLVMNKFGKISEAANLIPFPLLVPTRLPEFINITDVVLYTNDIVCLEYGFPQQQTNYSSLYICEKYIGNSGPPIMKVGPDADIISLEIETMSGPKKAEYVYGDWYQARMGNSDSLMRSGLPDDAWIWDKNSSSQRLRWVQYGILVSVYYQVDDPFTAVLDGDVIRITRDSYNPYVNQTDLMQIAVGMRKYKEVSNYYYLDEGG